VRWSAVALVAVLGACSASLTTVRSTRSGPYAELGAHGGYRWALSERHVVALTDDARAHAMPVTFEAGARLVVVGADGTALVVAGDGRVHRWRPTSAEVVELEPLPDDPFDPRGRRSSGLRRGGVAFVLDDGRRVHWLRVDGSRLDLGPDTLPATPVLGAAHDEDRLFVLGPGGRLFVRGREGEWARFDTPDDATLTTLVQGSDGAVVATTPTFAADRVTARLLAVERDGYLPWAEPSPAPRRSLRGLRPPIALAPEWPSPLGPAQLVRDALQIDGRWAADLPPDAECRLEGWDADVAVTCQGSLHRITADGLRRVASWDDPRRPVLGADGAHWWVPGACPEVSAEAGATSGISDQAWGRIVAEGVDAALWPEGTAPPCVFEGTTPRTVALADGATLVDADGATTLAERDGSLRLGDAMLELPGALRGARLLEGGRALARTSEGTFVVSSTAPARRLDEPADALTTRWLDDRRALAAQPRALLRTLDGGASWTPLPLPLGAPRDEPPIAAPADRDPPFGERATITCEGAVRCTVRGFVTVVVDGWAPTARVEGFGVVLRSPREAPDETEGGSDDAEPPRLECPVGDAPFSSYEAPEGLAYALWLESAHVGAARLEVAPDGARRVRWSAEVGDARWTGSAPLAPLPEPPPPFPGFAPAESERTPERMAAWNDAIRRFEAHRRATAPRVTLLSVTPHGAWLERCEPDEEAPDDEPAATCQPLWAADGEAPVQRGRPGRHRAAPPWFEGESGFVRVDGLAATVERITDDGALEELGVLQIYPSPVIALSTSGPPRLFASMRAPIDRTRRQDVAAVWRLDAFEQGGRAVDVRYGALPPICASADPRPGEVPLAAVMPYPDLEELALGLEESHAYSRYFGMGEVGRWVRYDRYRIDAAGALCLDGRELRAGGTVRRFWRASDDAAVLEDAEGATCEVVTDAYE